MRQPVDRADAVTGMKVPTSEARRESPERDGRQYLFVPYVERQEARAAGARWSAEKEKWFVPGGADMAPFSRWTDPPKVLSVMEMESDLGDLCKQFGLVLDGSPITDGEWHSVPVSTSSNPKAKKGAYRATIINGEGSGFVINHDSGDRGPWFSDGGGLTEEDREANRLIAEENRRQREATLLRERVAISERCTAKWERLAPAGDHRYLKNKQVDAFGLKQDGDKLVTAIRGADERIWSLQYIDERGGKLFELGGQKSGNFHVLGDLRIGNTVLFGEGYATCASLHMATRLPVVEVFDGSNIDAVLGALASKLAGKEKIVCGDDDVLTRSRILRTLNNLVVSEHAAKKLMLSRIDDEEIVIDGLPRKVKANPACTIELHFQVSPEGVQRVVGHISNSDTNERVAVKLVNTGREKALAAAAKYGAKTVFPVFGSLEGGPTDFNDLQVREGRQVVRRQIGHAMLSKLQAPGAEIGTEELAKRAIGPETVLKAAVDNRRYVGPVVGNTATQSVQDVGRRTAVTHELDRLDRVPAVGVTTKIAYSNGRGQVVLNPTLSKGGVER